MGPEYTPAVLNVNGQTVLDDGDFNLIAQKIRAMLIPFSTEISLRNIYIQDRDDIIYGDGLTARVNWTNNADRTLYNWCERLVDIQVSQLMGRSFQVYSTYEKRDLLIDQGLNDNDQLQQDKLMNSKAKNDADARAKIIRGLVDDNGADELWQTGSASCSAFGYAVYKSWMSDPEDVKNGDEDIPWHIEMLENPANFWAIWSSDNFRRRDADVYMYQISLEAAQSAYGQYLEEGQAFAQTALGFPLGDPNPVAQTQEEGTRPMVTVLEFTGKLPCYKPVKNAAGDYDLQQCEPGEEEKVNLLVVGDALVRIEADPDRIPRYYIIPNRRIQRRPWGLSDVTPTCIDTNVTFMERMSDWVTITNRALFQKYAGKGFEPSGIPHPSSRTIEIIPMDEDQSIEEIEMNTEYSDAYLKLLEKLETNFVRSAGISQVLFDNPQLDANSNQAMMTTMKGMIDTVERKQKIWTKTVIDMLEDALRTLAHGNHYPKIKAFVPLDEDWSLKVQWPSVMRKDDPQMMQMNINDWNTGTMSVETFMERRGDEDPSQEIDRLRDELQDPLTAAIRGQRLPLLAEQTISPAPDPSTVPPEQKHTFAWNLSATPEQAANLAETIPGMQNGPFGESMGPQGTLGAHAEDALANDGALENSKSQESYGTPETFDANGQPLNTEPGGAPDSTKTATKPGKKGTKNGKKPAPGVNSNGQTTPLPSMQGTADNNPMSPGIMSQPGSGASATTPQGAIAQGAQNSGA